MMLWFSRHRRFQERLSAYMDGELAQRDVRSVQTHLESCESCRREMAGLRVASAAMREMPDVDVPRSFALKPADVARPATQP
jgi:anti-sigma factor RsiW